MTRSGLAVKDISEEFCEVFMHPSVGVSRFVFPEKDDTCWICVSDILCTIEHPILTMEEEGTPFHRNQCPRLQRLIIYGRNRSVISHPHYAVVFVCNYILFLAYSIVNEYML